jgi:hypothetical protein
MFKHVLQGQSLFGVSDQNSLYKVFRLRAHSFLVDLIGLQVKVLNVAVGIVLSLSGERSLACEELIAEDTYCPNIYFVIIWFLIDKLWSHIVHSPAESGASLIYSVSRPAEVTQFHMHAL